MKIEEQPMSEYSGLAEKRASIYWWFSTLLIQELNDEQTVTLTGESGMEFLDALSMEGMVAEVDAVKSALKQLNSNGEMRLELAADFAQTFLRDNKHSALPYASVYLSHDGLLYQTAQKEMADMLQKEGLAVDKGMGEPADHIAVQLDYLGNLVLRGIKASDETDYREGLEKQLAFIDAQLMNWLPRFVKKSLGVGDACFYPAICSLLLSYLQQECAFLSVGVE